MLCAPELVADQWTIDNSRVENSASEGFSRLRGDVSPLIEILQLCFRSVQMSPEEVLRVVNCGPVWSDLVWSA